MTQGATARADSCHAQRRTRSGDRPPGELRDELSRKWRGDPRQGCGVVWVLARVGAIFLTGFMVLFASSGTVQAASVRAGAGAQAWGLVEGACRQDGDVFECASPTLFGDFFLDGRWRPLDSLSVGVSLGYGFSGGTPELRNSDGSGTRFETRLLRASLEPRFHLWPDGPVDFFFGAELGFLSVRESLVDFDGGTDTHTATGTQSGVLLGAHSGMSIPLWSSLELEFGLRAAFVNLPPDDVPELERNRHGTEFGQQLWVGGWLGLGWEFALDAR